MEVDQPHLVVTNRELRGGCSTSAPFTCPALQRLTPDMPVVSGSLADGPDNDFREMVLGSQKLHEAGSIFGCVDMSTNRE